MLKIILKISITLLVFTSTLLQAQEFQGKAIYQTKMNFDFDMKKDSTKSKKTAMMDDTMRKQIQEMLAKQMEKKYILTFNKTASLYKVQEELEKPKPASNGFSITFDNGSSDILYKNIQEGTFVKATESFGKKFLIKDTLEKLNWKIGKETKKIGNYLCVKATATIMVSDFDRKTMKEKDTKKELVITAWYTPEIPINNGPSKYDGLPGLILELHEEKMHYVCIKLVLNNKDKIDIVAPKKGKKITQKEFEIKMKKQSKKMRERFHREGGRKKGDKHSQTIFIGG